MDVTKMTVAEVEALCKAESCSLLIEAGNVKIVKEGE
jgi:hypothetical protein